jgi:thioesterase domain-containing protein
MTEMNNLLSIQQFATKYLEIIRRTQSHGPYRLAGWSMGGLIAYEMAYQLLNVGESVEFVGLIDPAIHIARPQATHQSDELSDVSVLLSALEVLAPTIDQATLLELKSLDKVHLILDRCKQIGALPMTLSLMDVQAKIQNLRTLAAVCASYSPTQLPIASHFFLATDELPPHLSRDPALFAGDKALEKIIGGTHQSIMNSPYVEQLADAINKSLVEFEVS